jgi:neutral ceramidase
MNCPFTQAPRSDHWLAGLSRVDITPRTPLVLGGYGVSYPFTAVDAPLRAKALALQWEDCEPVVIISVDTLKLRPTSIAPVRARLSDASNIDGFRFVFVATHTHEAPMLPGHYGHADDFLQSFLSEENLGNRNHYLAAFQDALVAVALEALENRAPATLEVGHGSADFAVNRRVKLADGSISIGENRSAWVDHDVPVLIVRDVDKTVRGILFGYACHGTTVRPQIASPDYMGYAEAELEARFPDAIALFLPGFGADVNPSPWSRDVEDYPRSDGGVANARRHGSRLARAVISVLEDGGEPVNGPMSWGRLTVELPLAPPPSPIELDRELDAAARDSIFGPRRMARARAYLDMHRRGVPFPTSVPLTMSHLGLGSLGLLFVAGEVVSDYARFLKAPGRECLWTVGYAQDCPAYVPSAGMIDEGGYEAVDSMVNNGWFGPFDKEVEERILSAAFALMQEDAA